MEGNFLSKFQALRISVLLLFSLSVPSSFAKTARSDIEYDSSLMPSERRLIRKDLALINELRSDAFVFEDLQNRSRDLQELKKNPQSWLMSRVSILVGPLNRPGFINPSANSTMRNLGAILATEGGTVRINSRELKVSSPAVGIIQYIQKPSEITIASAKPADALVNRIYRLALLFHDARHSDGASDKAVGIPHIICPQGHPYANQALCDRYVDASYGVEIFVGTALLNQYSQELSDSDKKVLAAWISSRKQHIVGKEIYGK